MYSFTPDHGIMHSEECSGSTNLLVRRGFKSLRTQEVDINFSLLNLASEEDGEVVFDSKPPFLYFKHLIDINHNIFLTTLKLASDWSKGSLENV